MVSLILINTHITVLHQALHQRKGNFYSSCHSNQMWRRPAKGKNVEHRFVTTHLNSPEGDVSGRGSLAQEGSQCRHSLLHWWTGHLCLSVLRESTHSGMNYQLLALMKQPELTQVQICQERGISTHFKHDLVEVRGQDREAIFKDLNTQQLLVRLKRC